MEATFVELNELVVEDFGFNCNVEQRQASTFL